MSQHNSIRAKSNFAACVTTLWYLGMCLVFPLTSGSNYKEYYYMREYSPASAPIITQPQDQLVIYNHEQSSKWAHASSPEQSVYATRPSQIYPQIYNAKSPVLLNSVKITGQPYQPEFTKQGTIFAGPIIRRFSYLGSSYGNVVPNEYELQTPFNLRRIRRSESNALRFLYYFIPYTAAIVVLAGLLFYFFFGFPAGLRGWLRKELQGIFGVGRNHATNNFQFRMDTYNSNTNSLLGQVRMALEGNWLRKLQDRMEKDYGKSSRAYAQCCIFPKVGRLGIADCQIFKNESRKKGLKCSTNLTYNFEFGQQVQNHRKNIKKSKKKHHF